MLSPEAKSADFWGLLLVYLARLQPQATKQSFRSSALLPRQHHHHHHQYIKLRSETLSVCLRRPQKSLYHLSRHSRVLPPSFPCPLSQRTRRSLKLTFLMKNLKITTRILIGNALQTCNGLRRHFSGLRATSTSMAGGYSRKDHDLQVWLCQYWPHPQGSRVQLSSGAPDSAIASRR